jgi:hypothetical protein
MNETAASATPPKRGRPKGRIVGPVKRALMDWLNQQPRGTALAEVRHAMLSARVITREDLAKNPRLLSGLLRSLYRAGHVLRKRNTLDVTVWRSAHPCVPEQPEAEQPPVEPERPQPTIALPRRINVMHGPTLTEPDFIPTRPGALDYMNIPSLINGQRVPRHINKGTLQ